MISEIFGELKFLGFQHISGIWIPTILHVFPMDIIYLHYGWVYILAEFNPRTGRTDGSIRKYVETKPNRGNTYSAAGVG